MNKKQKEQYKIELLERKAKEPVMIQSTGWSITLAEYVEQESWKRK
jgi:hypothetical protein